MGAISTFLSENFKLELKFSDSDIGGMIGGLGIPVGEMTTS